jgi:CheY-like chemotaxis protein
VSANRQAIAPRALVVENDLASRELLARVLRLRGVDAQTAVGLAQAAGLLRSAEIPYDLLVLDLNLEPVDGTELLRQVAAFPAGRRPARIVVIGQSVANFYPRLAELNLPLELLQKPVHLPSLMKVVDSLRGDESRRKAE